MLLKTMGIATFIRFLKVEPCMTKERLDKKKRDECLSSVRYMATFKKLTRILSDKHN